MKRVLLCACLASIALSMHGQNGVCCDPDSPNYATTGPCNGAGEPIGTYLTEGSVCDPDCSDFNPCDSGAQCYDPNDPVCSIPIDGGLGMLALAGGGLAISALRRRRSGRTIESEKI